MFFPSSLLSYPLPPNKLVKLVSTLCTPSLPVGALWYPSFGVTPFESLFAVVVLVSSFWSTVLPSALLLNPSWPHWYCTAPDTPALAAALSQLVYASSSCVEETPVVEVEAVEDCRRKRVLLEVVLAKGATVELKGTKKGRLFLLTIPKAERMVGLPTLQEHVCQKEVKMRVDNKNSERLEADLNATDSQRCRHRSPIQKLRVSSSLKTSS